MTALLEVKNLTKAFVGLVAVNDVSFSLQAGRITALIGPNGAGKTTCFNLVAGALRPTAGQVLFEGCSLEREPPEAVCRHGHCAHLPDRPADERYVGARECHGGRLQLDDERQGGAGQGV